MFNVDFLELLATAASLSMDAFSVSITIGLCYKGLPLHKMFLPAAAFGAFQLLMPYLGSLIALWVGGFLGKEGDFFINLAATLVILYIGFNMIRNSFKEKDPDCIQISFKNVFMLALATSLDAMAVGFSFETLGRPVHVLAGLAGVITLFLSCFGIMIGERLGHHFGKRAETFGGIVLCLVAVKIFFWP